MQQRPSRLAGVAAAIVATALPPACSAHHSTAEYDAKTIVEARGEIVTLLWATRTCAFTVSTKAIDGNEALWEIESADLTRLDRAGLPHDIVKIGDVVPFAGNPSTRPRTPHVRHEPAGRRRPRDPAARQRDAALRRGRPRRLHGSHLSPRTAGAAADNRFFGKVFVPMREGKPPAWVSNPPYTPDARKKQAAYDEVVDDPVLGCVRPGCRA